MSRYPFFSVVIPVYNGEKFIAQAIESVLLQTFSSWELIVVDDASTDDSAAIVSRYACEHSNILLLKNEENLKIRKSLNRGIEAAAGLWIVRLDADDFFSPVYLEKTVCHDHG